MLEAVLMKLKDALPGARIIPAPSAFLTDTAVYRYFPGKSGGRRKSGRLEVRFVSPSLAGAMAMYGSARSALVSKGGLRPRRNGDSRRSRRGGCGGLLLRIHKKVGSLLCEVGISFDGVLIVRYAACRGIRRGDFLPRRRPLPKEKRKKRMPKAHRAVRTGHLGGTERQDAETEGFSVNFKRREAFAKRKPRSNL